MKYIVSAYYYASETTHAFGPFASDAALNRFLANDKAAEKHDQWHVTSFNAPSTYGTGAEGPANIWRWN